MDSIFLNNILFIKRIIWLYSVLLYMTHYCICNDSLEDDSLILVTEGSSCDVFSTRCYEYIGCFYNGPPFYDPEYRPITLFPERNLKTEYLLYTPSNPLIDYKLNFTNESVIQSPVQANLTTKVLIPGFIVNITDSIFFKLKNQILISGKHNVIIIDWSRSNKFPYAQAVANARAVGAQVAYLLRLLEIHKNISMEDVHIIGHSLGAHIGGFAGERVKNLGRITGLDPAGPYYQNAPKSIRLDYTDALFVDVIHTSGGDNLTQGFGLGQTIGDMDFYPNGGTIQPMCVLFNTTNVILNQISKSCNHIMSEYYFYYSVNTCHFLAVHCQNYEKFKKGLCTEENSAVAEMGYHAKPQKGLKSLSRFYLQTKTVPPYCNTVNNMLENKGIQIF